MKLIQLLMLLLLNSNILGQAYTSYTTTVPSTIDSYQQPLVVIDSPGKALVVSGHSWGGSNDNYNDPIGLANKFNRYPANHIIAEYRGPNATPDSAGSRKARRDIMDARDWGMDNLDIDGPILFNGVSGAGHAGLMVASEYDRAFDFYQITVPVVDIIAWYKQMDKPNIITSPAILNVAPQLQAYIRNVCGGDPLVNGPAKRTCKRRSPIHNIGPHIKAQIDWHVGIADQVIPATQSLRGFNKLVGEEVFSKRVIKYVLKNKDLPNRMKLDNPLYCTNSEVVIYKKRIGNKRIIVHTGGHGGCFGSGFENYTFKSWS